MTIEEFNKWLKTQLCCPKLVHIRYKFKHEQVWTQENVILDIDFDLNPDDGYVWLDDWNEGQENVEILGCINICDIEIPYF